VFDLNRLNTIKCYILKELQQASIVDNTNKYLELQCNLDKLNNIITNSNLCNDYYSELDQLDKLTGTLELKESLDNTTYSNDVNDLAISISRYHKLKHLGNKCFDANDIKIIIDQACSSIDRWSVKLPLRCADYSIIICSYLRKNYYVVINNNYILTYEDKLFDSCMYEVDIIREISNFYMKFNGGYNLQIDTFTDINRLIDTHNRNTDLKFRK
jgi:hypothetical protein